MSEDKIVDIELYNLLKENEIHAYIANEEAELTALVYVWSLRKFAEILDYSYFDDGGIEIIWMGDYAAIRIDDVIEEYFGHNLEAYKGAIGDYEYNRYLELKRMEG